MQQTKRILGRGGTVFQIVQLVIDFHSQGNHRLASGAAFRGLSGADGGARGADGGQSGSLWLTGLEGALLLPFKDWGEVQLVCLLPRYLFITYTY